MTDMLMSSLCTIRK